jgi:cell fate regulator YaaT (PSP1 superfamily)
MNNVTETIDKMIKTIPESMQNSVLEEIQAVISEKHDELEWNIQFQQSQENLIAAAKKVKEEIAAGMAKPMDYKKL